MIKVDTKNLDEKKKRIAQLPQYMLDAVKGLTRARAYDFIKQWQRDLRSNAHHVAVLKVKTMKAKMAKGYKKPFIPLYGLGDADPHTYINMMRIYAMKKGYKVAPGRKGHHESGLKLRDLFIVHEYGTTIVKGNTTIRIPARPTFFLSYQTFLVHDVSRFKNGKREMMKAAREMILTGRKTLFSKIHSRYARGRDKNEAGE
jgi:hypothetical protein